jgi:hypothetical protein
VGLREGRHARQIRRLETVTAGAFEITGEIVDTQAELALEGRGLIQLIETPEGALTFEHRRRRVRPLDRVRVVNTSRWWNV